MADETRGKIFQRDSYMAGPEQLWPKGTLEDEVIVLIELRWQSTDTSGSTRTYLVLKSREDSRTRLKREPVYSEKKKTRFSFVQKDLIFFLQSNGIL